MFGEELEAGDFLLVLVHLLGAVRDDHVVKPLIRGARHLGMLKHNIQILLERPVPVQLSIVADIELGPQFTE